MDGIFFSAWKPSALIHQKPMLKEAKNLWPQGTLLQAEGTRLPFKDKSVDVVVFITSLEFIPDAAGALRKQQG